MNPPVAIKICGLTTEADVDLALELGSDFFGFIVYSKSPRGLSLERAIELAGRVPEDRRVVVDVETSREALLHYREAGFGRFQIHAHLPLLPDKIAAWSEIAGPDRLWLAPRIAETDDFPEEALPFAETIVVDTYSPARAGGTGKTGDWGRFAQWRQTYGDTRWILAGGLGPDNVAEAIRRTGARHLDVNSGVESSPGRKNPEKLRELFRVLRS